MTQVASVLVTPRMKGAWEECQKEGCKLMFYRHPQGDKRYSLSDKIGICPLCIFEKQKENDTLPGRKGNISEFVSYKYSDSKPGDDTL